MSLTVAFFSDMLHAPAHRHVPDQYESQQGRGGGGGSGRSVTFPIFPHPMQDKRGHSCARLPAVLSGDGSMNIHVRLPELLAGQIFAARWRLGRRLQQEAWSPRRACEARCAGVRADAVRLVTF